MNIKVVLFVMAVLCFVACNENKRSGVADDPIAELRLELFENWHLVEDKDSVNNNIRVRSRPARIDDYSPVCFYTEIELVGNENGILPFSQQLLHAYSEYYYATNASRGVCEDVSVDSYFLAGGGVISGLDRAIIKIASVLETGSWESEYSVKTENYEDERIGSCIRGRDDSKIHIRSISGWTTTDDYRETRAMAICRVEGQELNIDIEIRLGLATDDVDLSGSYVRMQKHL